MHQMLSPMKGLNVSAEEEEEESFCSSKGAAFSVKYLQLMISTYLALYLKRLDLPMIFEHASRCSLEEGRSGNTRGLSILALGRGAISGLCVA